MTLPTTALPSAWAPAVGRRCRQRERRDPGIHLRDPCRLVTMRRLQRRLGSWATWTCPQRGRDSTASPATPRPPVVRRRSWTRFWFLKVRSRELCASCVVPARGACCSLCTWMHWATPQRHRVPLIGNEAGSHVGVLGPCSLCSADTQSSACGKQTDRRLDPSTPAVVTATPGWA